MRTQAGEDFINFREKPNMQQIRIRHLAERRMEACRDQLSLTFSINRELEIGTAAVGSFSCSGISGRVRLSRLESSSPPSDPFSDNSRGWMIGPGDIKGDLCGDIILGGERSFPSSKLAATAATADAFSFSSGLILH